MRIGIDARAASHPQVGGFKTYTQALVRALAGLDRKNEYVLYLDRANGFAAGMPSNFIATPVRAYGPLLGAGVREQWSLPRQARRDNLNVIHSPCNTSALNMSCKTVITLHDVITISSQGRDQTLPLGESLKRWLAASYSKWVSARMAARADAIITVSDFEKKQILECLGVDPGSVFAIHLAPLPVMQPLVGPERRSAIRQVKTRFGVQRPYVLGVGYEPRKNLRRIVAAYKTAVSSGPIDLHLVMVVAHRPTQLKLRDEILDLGLSENVIVLDAVPSDELALLYNCAAALVYPSLRESFGLPVVEAMACGTPVITSNGSSLPEISGDAAILVDPESVGEIADAIDEVVNAPERAAELRKKGLLRAREFSWKQTALETLAVYDRVQRS